MENTILIFIIAYLIGRLQERWIYFKKTNKHLQDVKKV